MIETVRHYGRGVLLAAGFALISTLLSELAIFKQNGINPLIIGIVLGIIYGNSLRPKLPKQWAPGIVFSAKNILRLGVILYGFSITFQEAFGIGWRGLLLDAIMVFATLGIGIWAGLKLFKLDKETTLLTSAGSAICGAAAVLAADSAIKAPAHKVAVAVATVVIFGTLAMFLLPILYEIGLFPWSPEVFGIYIGASTHEVAHVVGSAGSLGPEFTATAIVSKMVRVILLAPAVLVIAYFFAGSGTRKHITVPAFAVWFLVIVGIHSVIPLPEHFIGIMQHLDIFLLTMAMSALGMETNLKKVKEIGPKPFLLASLLFVWLIGGGAALTWLLLV